MTPGDLMSKGEFLKCSRFHHLFSLMHLSEQIHLVMFIHLECDAIKIAISMAILNRIPIPNRIAIRIAIPNRIPIPNRILNAIPISIVLQYQSHSKSQIESQRIPNEPQSNPNRNGIFKRLKSYRRDSFQWNLSRDWTFESSKSWIFQH